MKKFWNFVNKDDSTRELIFDGVIAEESWFGDEITPKEFRDELNSSEGDLLLRINSPGGDCIAASQIYTMLMEYKGKVTVEIDGIAASAASVVAMAGSNVIMSPTALMMIHNPMTFAAGDHNDMEHAINVLNKVKESIINAYELKSGLSRNKLSELMDDETWMDANAALNYGFIDEILGKSKESEKTENPVKNKVEFSQRKSNLKLVALASKDIPEPKDNVEEKSTEEKPEVVDAKRIYEDLELMESLI